MMQILNIASYKFIALSDLPAHQSIFLEKTNNLRLKGTILLSAEGINISLAGIPEDIALFVSFLQSTPLFADMTFRESYSDFQPFKQMRVKIKPEIITLRQADIHPEQELAPDISPAEFKKWLDEKRDITILDTRNDYEVKFGTFEKAQQLYLDEFGEFPDAINQVSRDKPIVMFCTGGVRCEKAAWVMLNAGYSNVYQLKGGILNYFAEVGAEHYQGECFVFDERVAVDATLNPSGTKQCIICQGPIVKQEQIASQTSCGQCASIQ